MLFLYVAGFSLIIAGMLYARHRVFKNGGEKTDHAAGSFAFTVTALFLVTVGLLISTAAWHAQIDHIEDIKKFAKIEAIYQAKADSLTAEFAKHLAEAYPKHERDIYEKISPEQAAIYFAKYPELKASDTLMKLVENINELQSAVYAQKVHTEETSKKIRVNLRSPLLFTFMIPKE